MKNFNIMGGRWKIWFLRGVAKHQYIGGNCIKGGARTVCRFKRGASGKRWCFWGGLITHLHTMLKVSFLSHISHKMRYMLQDLNIDQENTYIHIKLPLFVFTFTFMFFTFYSCLIEINMPQIVSDFTVCWIIT